MLFIRELSFRNKLIGIIALPLAFIGYLSLRDVQQALTAQRTAADQLVVSDQDAAITELAQALGNERSVLYDPTATDEDLVSARTATDGAEARLQSPEVDLDDALASRVKEVYDEAVALRALIGGETAVVHAAIASRQNEAISPAIEQFGTLPGQALRISAYDAADAETLATSTTATLIRRAREALAVEGIVLQEALAEGAPSHATLERLGASIGASNGAIDAVTGLGTPAVSDDVNAFLQGQEWADYQALRDRFNRLLTGQHIRLEPTTVLDQRGTVDGFFASLEADFVVELRSDANELQRQAWQDLLLSIVTTLGVLALLTGFLYLLARSMSRSLGRLEHRATQIATVELPSVVRAMRAEGDLAEVPRLTEIPVETGDEIGRLSLAFNQLQTTALQLAGEQAASRAVVAHMFVNLGRRNQKLLMRMLESLDELEREESDPDRLARLYDVDHLATRMRRNAESLLILADAGVVRRFDGPVPVSELLRSTMAEVAEFERVQLRIMDDVELAGDVAADIGHLLAELTENALRFSPPSEPVEIVARYTRMGYIVAVLDSGMGLTPAEIVEANAQVRAARDSAETPSKHLGLFVVGKLAGRHGIAVEIFERVPAGLTVRVRIPAALIVSQAPDWVREIDSVSVAVMEDPVAADDRTRPGSLAADGADGRAEPMVAAGPLPAARIEDTELELVSSRVASRATSQPPTVRAAASIPAAMPHQLPDRSPSSGPPRALDVSSSPEVPSVRSLAPSPPDRPRRRSEMSLHHPPSIYDDLPATPFGSTRRVAGANLPGNLGDERLAEDPIDGYRPSADSVASNLRALQRGLRGASAAGGRGQADQDRQDTH